MRHSKGFVLAGMVTMASTGQAGAAPEAWLCAFAPPFETLRFTLDPAQFADPVSPDEPPRRQLSRVTLPNVELTAEAILTQDGGRGFFLAERAMLLIRHSDGSATLTADGARLGGECRPEG
ncbi:hypothetical protein [Thetidibacter halocola]|uniref:C-type lysozyme inhibitor domain-containing protein n=1 Tax=Thetidibacter halocola TaxID=2827239 RepID=A0A8J7WCC5_9RHOB|nr:hypothetical protein [Thetidibacter halocola]MBS0122548.1 hypothetical protein [Thetidibacter halocola]